MRYVSLVTVLMLVVMAQPQRIVQESPELRELRGVREEHKTMMRQLERSETRLTEIERREGETEGAKLAERLAKVEGEFALMLGVCLATFGMLASSSVWIFRNLLGAKDHGTAVTSALQDLRQALIDKGAIDSAGAD